MALSDVLKKKQETAKADDKKLDGKKANLIDDVRVFIAILVLACVALIVATVFGAQSIQGTMSSIEEVKNDYKKNQQAIANLLILQSKSEEYKAQRDEYELMISDEKLNQQQIMINMENDVESHNCLLTNIEFSEATNTGLVNQISVTLTITGKYDDIMKFAYDTVNGEQIKRIDTLKVTSTGTGEKGENEIKAASIVVVLFSN